MSLLLTTLAAALTWGGERLLEAGVETIKSRLRDRAEADELAEITAQAIEAAIRLSPTLQEDLRSGAFIQGVVTPLVLDSLKEVSTPIAVPELVEGYIRRFVLPWAADGNPGPVLSGMLETDRQGLTDAMTAFTQSLRTGLLASIHWKDVGRDRTLAEIHSGVFGLLAVQPRAATPEVDLATARADSRLASQDLLEWRRTISGLFLARPELDLLARRIRTEPRGRTLLVGEAGAGKSALLSELTERLQRDGMTVFAIKADMLPADAVTTADLSRALGLKGDLESDLVRLAQTGPVVLIIDQMDAVSEVMDRSSSRMKLLLRIANGFVHDRRYEDGPPIHVLVSSRPFEAAHDGRFQSLQAEAIKLDLPPYESVRTLLDALKIDATVVPEGLKETLRRPFALRLFVDLVERGVDARSVTAGELLNLWLVTANLGGPLVRPRVIGFLEHLAQSMTETETLWRPADALDLVWLDAVTVAEASGLILRQDGRIGFSHQSWLDDFQAKAVQDGAALARFAWERQDGLFARATVLRGLERLRRHETDAYETALDLLLGAETTRRHLRHLVVDLIAGQDAPKPRETGWIARIFAEDVALTRRATSRIADRWPAWRAALSPSLPGLMAVADLKWTAIRLITAEAVLDEDSATAVLRAHWSGADRQADLFEALWQAKIWTPWAAERVRDLMAQHDFSNFAVSHYIEDLIDNGRTDAALDLLSAYLERKPLSPRQRFRMDGLEKLVATAPLALARTLTPWFIDLIRSEADEDADAGSVRDDFPSVHTLPFDWNSNEDEDNIYTAFTAALASAASTDPQAVVPLLADLTKLEIEEAQIVVADTYRANPMRFAADALAFLMSDSRRLRLGSAQFDDEEGVGYTVQGWSSLELISAISPHLSLEDLCRLKALIERWDPYRSEIAAQDPPRLRLMRLGWVVEARYQILERLPDSVMAPRERRQIREWRASRPRLLNTRRRMGHTVGAPMSIDQMAKATDAHLLGLLDDCRDGTGWGDRSRSAKRRHIRRSGGAVQVGRSLAALSQRQPNRILRLIRDSLSPERHQSACGAALQELAGNDTVAAQEMVALIHVLHEKGFDSEDWRRDAAWAFQKLAGRLNGLQDADIALIETWIVDDAETARRRTERRTANEAANRSRNAKPDQVEAASAVIFGVRLGSGFNILPQDNYTFLSAIADGALCREPPAPDVWLEALERHVERYDDPKIWESALAYHGRALFWADRPRTLRLFAALWRRYPDAFTPTVGGILWGYHDMLPDEVLQGILRRWISGGTPRDAQAAGEIAVAAKLVNGDADPLAGTADALLAGPHTPGQSGAVFASAAAWRENVGSIRVQAHEVLMRFADGAQGDIAEAVSTALDGDRTLTPDAMTEALLRLALENPPILKAALNSRFADGLQSLLLHPGFDEIVLAVAEVCVDEIVDDGDSGRSLDNDFVTIAIALQRAADPQRGRAMDLYERLLDANVYGADRAAVATLRN